MVSFLHCVQKNAEELLDKGSIAYLQEDGDYYNRGLMYNDELISQTGLRDEGGDGLRRSRIANDPAW